MISRMSRSISAFFVVHGIIPDEEKEVYEYSFEILLSTTASLLYVVILSVISKTILLTALYLLGFIPLRLIAGGYHAKNHFRCFLILVFAYSGFLMINRFLPVEYMLPIIILCVLSTVFLVFLLAPSEDKNKTLSSAENTRFKRLSRFTVIAYAALIFLLSIVIPDRSFAVSVALGNYTIGIALLANSIKCRNSESGIIATGRKEVTKNEETR